MPKEYTVTFSDKQFTVLTNMLQLIVVGGLEFRGVGNAIPTTKDLEPIWKLLLGVAIAPQNNKEAIEHEREFLKYFFKRVQPCLGPADSEIIDSIKQEYKKRFSKELPPGYPDPDKGE